MNTINLEKELLLEKSNSLIETKNELLEAEKLLESVKHLLIEDVKNDKDVLLRHGFDTALREANNIANRVVDLRGKVNSTNSRIFSIEEIKRVAIKYRLRFLPSHIYKASIPADLAIKIREAKNEFQKLNVSENGYSDERYMILAPKESFNLEVKPEDPLFFIRLNNGQYYLVHKWGNDLSLSRLITSWHHRCGFNNFLFNIAAVTLCIYGFYKYFTLFNNLWIGIPSAIIVAIIFICHWCYISDDDTQYYSNDCWASKFKN